MLTGVFSTGKNLYTNEYVAIKLVSAPCPAPPCVCGLVTAQETQSNGALGFLGAHQVPGAAAAPGVPLLQAAQHCR